MAKDLSDELDRHMRALVSKLKLIPDEARSFTMSMDDAIRGYRLTRELLERLLAYGLPAGNGPDGPRMDHLDLRNAAFRLGFGPIALAARRFWAASLNQPGSQPRTYEIFYYATCPTPGHGLVCGYRFLLPGGGYADCEVPADVGASYKTTLSLATEWPLLPPESRHILQGMEELEFMYLPRPLKTDLGFIRQTGLSDCLGTTRLLVHEGRRHGVPVRPSFGFIVAPPYVSLHNWAEFLVGDRWVPIDPVLIKFMVDMELLDACDWPGFRSPGAMLVRVGDEPTWIGAHEGDPVPAEVRTRRLRGS
ncbi:transglutaminase domain-containing protein [Nonomuraea sp. NPDC050451]|uniref:transglutaminase domain-containing protein n=1 Tax=Nonomuraea sp. NPDC050451 TaxID=3364364 RepID=UPI0037BAAD3A